MFGIARRTGGANGLKIKQGHQPTSVEGLGFSVDKPFQYRYLWILLLAVLCFVGVANLLKKSPGRAVVAVATARTGAAVSSVDIRQVKVHQLRSRAAIGGLAGVMYAMNTGFVAGTSFTFVLMVDLLVAWSLVVSPASRPIFGALVVVFVREFTKNISIPLGFYTLDGDGPLSQAIFGIILIAGGVLRSAENQQLRENGLDSFESFHASDRWCHCDDGPHFGRRPRGRRPVGDGTSSCSGSLPGPHAKASHSNEERHFHEQVTLMRALAMLFALVACGCHLRWLQL
ncbi:MAG: hypothetical protein R2710_08905 [Acidimicrobiales bacterium]